MPALTIPNRFHGPPDSGNGGYVCGLVANFIEGPAQVRLHKPPPLDLSLTVQSKGKTVSLMQGEILIAVGVSISLDLEVPPPPTLQQAQAAAKHYVGFNHHFFPTCFVCGPNRKNGDGLHIFPGFIPNQDMVAAPWTPDDSLSDPNGFILPEFIWSSLDCPGAFAFGRDSDIMVLGTMAAEIIAPIVPGEECIVIAWPLRSEGRKHFSGTALFTARGHLIAKASATWIELESLDQLI